MAEVINFYSAEKKYGEFSNFAEYPITIEGQQFPTSEHYFQAMKYCHIASRFRAICEAATPGIAATMGRNRAFPLREDWESVKDEIMMVALRAKFTQHPVLRRLLSSTGDAKLVEHTKNDRYWGDGGDGSGRNMLGISLMKIREELKSGEI